MLLKSSSFNHLSAKGKAVFELILSKYTAELTKITGVEQIWE